MRFICRAILIIAGLSVGLVVLAVVLEGLGVLETSPETCEELAPEIVELSEDSGHPFSPQILKISQIETLTPTGDNILECSGLARWSRGEDSVIQFHLEEDADGDRFIGYQGQ